MARGRESTTPSIPMQTESSSGQSAGLSTNSDSNLQYVEGTSSRVTGSSEFRRYLSQLSGAKSDNLLLLADIVGSTNQGMWSTTKLVRGYHVRVPKGITIQQPVAMLTLSLLLDKQFENILDEYPQVVDEPEWSITQKGILSGIQKAIVGDSPTFSFLKGSEESAMTCCLWSLAARREFSRTGASGIHHSVVPSEIDGKPLNKVLDNKWTVLLGASTNDSVSNCLKLLKALLINWMDSRGKKALEYCRNQRVGWDHVINDAVPHEEVTRRIRGKNTKISVPRQIRHATRSAFLSNAEKKFLGKMDNWTISIVEWKKKWTSATPQAQHHSFKEFVKAMRAAWNDSNNFHELLMARSGHRKNTIADWFKDNQDTVPKRDRSNYTITEAFFKHKDFSTLNGEDQYLFSPAYLLGQHVLEAQDLIAAQKEVEASPKPDNYQSPITLEGLQALDSWHAYWFRKVQQLAFEYVPRPLKVLRVHTLFTPTEPPGS